MVTPMPLRSALATRTTQCAFLSGLAQQAIRL